MNKTIRIEYDDQLDDVIDKVNGLLLYYNLKLESDDKSHDGFDILNLVEKEPHE